MRVTRIAPQKKRPGRRNIYIDGSFAIGVGAETLLRSGLRTGDEVDPAFLSTLERTERESALRAAALRLLSARPRSVRELRDRLAPHCPPGIHLRELSMGMSGDFQIAIEEGATIVRIGSALLEGVGQASRLPK